jgi:hypothetical protein
MKNPIIAGEAEEIPLQIPLIPPAAREIDLAGTNPCIKLQQVGSPKPVQPNPIVRQTAEAILLWTTAAE